MTRYDPRQPEPDPKQAVIAYLLYANAKAPTIHFAKERSTPHYRVYGMKYEDITGQQRYCLCFLTQHESGHWSIGRAIFPDPVDEGEMNNIDKSRPRFILLGNTPIRHPRSLACFATPTFVRTPQTRVDSVLLQGYTLRREKTESLVLSIPEA